MQKRLLCGFIHYSSHQFPWIQPMSRTVQWRHSTLGKHCWKHHDCLVYVDNSWATYAWNKWDSGFFCLVAFLLLNLYQSSPHTSTPSYLNSTWDFQNWAINHFEKGIQKRNDFYVGSSILIEFSKNLIEEYERSDTPRKQWAAIARSRASKDEKSRWEKYILVSNGRETHKQHNLKGDL